MQQQSNRALHNSNVVSRVVLASTYAVVVLMTVLMLVSFDTSQPYSFNRSGVCAAAFLYIFATHILSRRGYRSLVAYAIVLFYMLLATGISWFWGINTPLGVLIFGLAIMVAGILLTARHAIFAGIMASSIILSIQASLTFEWHEANAIWSDNISSFGDATAYCTTLGILSVISWLYNREMERSLTQAKQAETALLRQKAALRQHVKSRTSELRRVQLEEMQQMYHFAELGQLGVTLLHDLANHLSALNLEIEDLRKKERTESIIRIQRIINYLEGVVDRTRDRLQGNTQTQRFNIIRKTSETVAFLRYKAAKSGVVIDWDPAGRAWEYVGDPDSFNQIVAIVTSNAIDAYDGKQWEHPAEPPLVTVVMNRTDTHIIIKISDRGRGILKSERKYLFKPSHSSKKSGLGLGLYIVKQIVEMQFAGTITVKSTDETEFTISLPLQKTI